MRERTPLPTSLLSRLSNLKLLTTNGVRNASLPLSTPDLPVLTVKSAPKGQSPGDNTVEHCWALILATAKGVVEGTDRIQNRKAGRRDGDAWQGESNIGLR